MSQEVEIQIIKAIVSKLDSSLEKITEVSNNISRLLAVHDERLSNLEKLSNRQEKDNRELQFRVANVSREIAEQFSEVENKIERKLKDFSNDMREDQKELSLEVKGIEERLLALERWRWLLLGAASVIGYIVAQVPKIMPFI